ncbi:hypothetical protein [Sphingomonas sp. OTU376]|uniref:hypothetical protein n=1 Tax=Sphingomonas sp. OTU376 TaxID=3043863 RepID=UPI00313AB2E4
MNAVLGLLAAIAGIAFFFAILGVFGLSLAIASLILFVGIATALAAVTRRRQA